MLATAIKTAPVPSPTSWRWGAANVLLAVVSAGLGAAIAPRLRSPAAEGTRAEPTPAPVPAADAVDRRTTVALTGGKLKAAGIEVGRARRETLSVEVGVPGQLAVNADRRVEIRPRVPGVVRSVSATLGRSVKAGEPLVTLDSAEVGTGRLNLRARQRELVTARVEATWRREVADNVEALLPLLRKYTPAKQLEQTFRDRSLGAFRGTLLGTYADFEVAAHEEEKQSTLNKQGLVGEHPVFVTQHTREATQARFEAQVEQVRFDAGQGARVAEQAVRAAEAAVVDAAQRLRILGVPEDVARALVPPADATRVHDEDVTAYVIVAPFDGTIVARSAVPSQRAEPADVLFTLADLTTVRVSANVPESRMGLLTRGGSPTIRLSAAAYPGETFEARVISVGAEVDPATRSVPILAELPNPDGRLRPGMFATVRLPSPERTTGLTVPASAVVEVDGRSGVFRPEPGDAPGRYTFAPVVAGPESGGRRPIASGLAEGDGVVVAGVFTLKSELILQNESGED